MSTRLILYDTCNYRDYPVGGQLTSIRNFLRYLMETYPEHAGDVLLVGVSPEESEVGRVIPIEIAGQKLSFLAVTKAETDQGKVKKSLRLEYVKGLLRCRKQIGIRKEDCNYIHTPEAFGVVRMLRPGAVCFVFSHGSYIDMWKKLRFFNKMPWFQKLFQQFLLQVIRKASQNLVLDRKTWEEYRHYSEHVVLVGNSIECQPYLKRKKPEGPVKLLYAGRLSDGKNLGPVVEAVKTSKLPLELTLLGDGEEKEHLMNLAGKSPMIFLPGAVAPAEVSSYMRKADILIMNSKYEGIPMVILEGLSHGLPVITTDVGGIGEVLHYGADSEKTDGNAESIHDALERILASYESYAEAAYKTAAGFDYRMVNAHVFRQLNEKLGWICLAQE